MASDAQDDFFGAYWEEVDLVFGYPAPRSKISVGLRLLFALPHLLVLVVLAAVSIVLAVVGWFAALRLDRLPRRIAVFQMRSIEYQARVQAYLFLLVDDYPPFSLTAAEYPVTVEIRASRLSPAAVLFRWVLLIPASVVFVISILGLILLSPFLWVMRLVGRGLPLPFFEATAALIRYQLRYVAYAVLVTDEYPRHFFGDFPGSGDEPRLVLSPEAKRLLIAIVVVVAFAGSLGAARLVVGGNPGTAALARLDAASAVYKREVSQCPAGPGRLRCVERAERTVVYAWTQYAEDLASGYHFAPRKSRARAVRAIDASTDVGMALWISSEAKTESAHRAAYEKVLKRIKRFESVLRGWRGGRPRPTS